jgi:hypothetical protein
MHIGRTFGCVFVVGAVSLTNGCAQNVQNVQNVRNVPRPVTVKTIMQDVEGYSSREFTPASLPDEVQKAVVNADSQPVGFHRLVLDMTTDGIQNGGDGVTRYTSHSTYENQGNGLVSSVDTLSSNGIQSYMYFNLSYRNIYSLRTQTLATGAVNASKIPRTQAISHFDTPAAGHDMRFSYDIGYEGQTKNFVHNETNCVFGRSFDASVVSPKMSGTARDLDCQIVNLNGVVTSKQHMAYLDKYGFAVVLKRENYKSNFTYTVTDFRAE